MSDQATTYDELPYDTGPMSATHPDNLAAVATLYGMRPPAPERCRVLELGCGTGYNLIAMAHSLPHAQLTGIDLSPRQIVDGMATVDKLKLPNVTLKALSLLDVDETFGQFDYIISHGVYSWVPDAVQDKILDICARNLTPNGVAYVSYNTYPGWHQRGMVREMMNFHTREFADPRQRVEQARGLLDFLIEGYPKESNPTYRSILIDERKLLADAADTYVFHEHLEEVNQPVFFHEFIGRAGAKGLQYLNEAKPHSPLQLFPAPTRETLKQIAADLIDQEQYLDFLHNRTFRRTLLCHRGHTLNRDPAPETAFGLLFSSFGHLTNTDADMTNQDVATFRGEVFKGVTNMPLVKIALTELMQACPGRLHFEELFQRVWRRLQSGSTQMLTLEEARPLLGGALLSSYQSTLVRLHVLPQPFTLRVGERPLASALARWEAASAEKAISNLCHCNVELDKRERMLLTHLDGTHDHAALAAKMAGMVNAEDLQAGWVPAQLNHLAHLALLPAYDK
jgi:SAM-dependent methyltransferase/methyltransferase-like protein